MTHKYDHFSATDSWKYPGSLFSWGFDFAQGLKLNGIWIKLSAIRSKSVQKAEIVLDKNISKNDDDG